MDLYELYGNLEWIVPIIEKYNKLGFRTVTSQPGKQRVNGNNDDLWITLLNAIEEYHNL